ncbi:MAG: SCO family protein [candidate division NC10 bacterium]|nr:SCO family protein [candidate division NC10 bacterium]
MRVLTTAGKARWIRPTLRIGVPVALWLGAVAVGLWLWADGSKAGPFQSLRALTRTTRSTLEDLEIYGTAPSFSLIERSGRAITLEDFQGKVWVANFIYTQCTETCPTQSLQILRLQSEFARDPDLRLVSITVDPERDTPEVLARYAQRYEADPERWLFLTGPKRAIYHLAADGFKLSVVDADDPKQTSDILPFLGPRTAFATHGSQGLIIHSSRFVLVDRHARIRAYHQPTDQESLERLRRNLRVLLSES